MELGSEQAVEHLMTEDCLSDLVHQRVLSLLTPVLCIATLLEVQTQRFMLRNLEGETPDGLASDSTPDISTRMNLHDSLRDLGIGVGGPAGGLLVANIVPDPIMANLSVTLGSLAALTVIIKNVIDIWKNNQK